MLAAPSPSRSVTATPCDLCGRLLTYAPGHASEVLTAHYNREHRRHLTGRLLLHDARNRFGLGTPTGIRRQAAVILWREGYSAREIGRVFGVTGATINADLRQAGSASPIPDPAGKLAELADRAEKARRTRQALRDARAQFGRDTPTGIRREVAAVLHDSRGMSFRDIGAIFGVTAAPIQQSLARYRRPASGYDAAERIRDLARQAQEARQAHQIGMPHAR